jgi:cytochrome c2
MPNYNYSPAVKTSGIVWDAAALDAYLEDPKNSCQALKWPFRDLRRATSERA